jgi:hypothetical protein
VRELPVEIQMDLAAFITAVVPMTIDPHDASIIAAFYLVENKIPQTNVTTMTRIITAFLNPCLEPGLLMINDATNSSI